MSLIEPQWRDLAHLDEEVSMQVVATSSTVTTFELSPEEMVAEAVRSVSEVDEYPEVVSEMVLDGLTRGLDQLSSEEQVEVMESVELAVSNWLLAEKESQ